MVNWALWRWGIGVQRLSALAPHPRAMLSPFSGPTGRAAGDGWERRRREEARVGLGGLSFCIDLTIDLVPKPNSTRAFLTCRSPQGSYRDWRHH